MPHIPHTSSCPTLQRDNLVIITAHEQILVDESKTHIHTTHKFTTPVSEKENPQKKKEKLPRAGTQYAAPASAADMYAAFSSYWHKAGTRTIDSATTNRVYMEAMFLRAIGFVGGARLVKKSISASIIRLLAPQKKVPILTAFSCPLSRPRR
jgi:hypothetical protein